MDINTIDLIFCILCLCIFVIGTVVLHLHGKRPSVGTSKQGLIDSIKYLNK